MPIVADAEQLQIDAAERLNKALIAHSLLFKVICVAVRHMCVRLVDVHVVKEVVVHEIAVAVRVRTVQTAVFVKVYGAHFGKVQYAVLIALYKIFIGANRRRACCKAQHAVRLQKHLAADDAGCNGAHFFIGFRFDNTHLNIHPFNTVKRRPYAVRVFTQRGSTYNYTIKFTKVKAFPQKTAKRFPEMPKFTLCRLFHRFFLF